MFSYFGANTNRIHNIGTLNVYADSIKGIFIEASGIKATVNIYTNPEYGTNSNYFNSLALYNSATANGSNLVINYSNNTTNIDDIIATKSDNSNVTKGTLLD